MKSKHQTFGIVADVHHGMLPDTNSRLEKFIEEAETKNVDFFNFCCVLNKLVIFKGLCIRITPFMLKFAKSFFL